MSGAMGIQSWLSQIRYVETCRRRSTRLAEDLRISKIATNLFREVSLCVGMLIGERERKYLLKVRRRLLFCVIDLSSYVSVLLVLSFSERAVVRDFIGKYR